MSRSRLGILVVCALWASAAAGCALGHQQQYQFGQGWQTLPEPTAAASSCSEAQICEGRPNKLVDGVGWVLGIPEKIMLWDSRVDNHAVSADTTVSVSNYLTQNQLPDVCVRVNEYAPGAEWRRLCANEHIGSGWRYTMGTLSLLGYTIIPGRLAGGDRYNPYTNSVYVYSDVPSLAIKAAAYAKDVHQRDYPGTYAVVNQLPLVSLWHETVATRDALGYVRTVGNVAQQAEAQRILYPSYCITVGGAIPGLGIIGPAVTVGSALVGHVAGRLQTQTPQPEVDIVAAPAPAAEPTSVETAENPPPHDITPLAHAQPVSESMPPR